MVNALVQTGNGRRYRCQRKGTSMVVLRIWHSAKKSGGGWGHSSLQVGGPPPAGIYISWWPSNLDGRPFKSDSWFAESMKVDDDIRLEGQPNEIIYINELD